MEMWQKYTILFFLTAAGAAMVMPGKHHIFVDDAQNTENVLSGSSVILHCCLNSSAKCRVSWFFKASGFNQTQMKSERICNFTEKLQPNMCNNSCYDNACNISNVNEANAGLYSCEATIEIPKLETLHSSETKVVVKNLRKNATVLSNTTINQVIPKMEKNWWMWHLVWGSSVILIILLIICAVQRNRCNRSIVEEPVYINTRPMNKQPSPQPGMLGNSLKTALSSQDLTPRAGRRYDEGKRRYKH